MCSICSYVAFGISLKFPEDSQQLAKFTFGRHASCFWKTTEFNPVWLKTTWRDNKLSHFSHSFVCDAFVRWHVYVICGARSAHTHDCVEHRPSFRGLETHHNSGSIEPLSDHESKVREQPKAWNQIFPFSDKSLKISQRSRTKGARSNKTVGVSTLWAKTQKLKT